VTGTARCSARAVRAVLAVVVLAVSVAGALGGLPGTATAASAQSATADQACSRVDVLLMIDTSASLRNTDPDDQRVAAAEVLLRSLAGSAQAGGTTVDVTVAAFGTDAVEVGRGSLPGGVEGAVEIVRPFADRETDLNTDYVLALRFAVQHFQAVTDLPSQCKRLVWFTDGAYSLDDLAAPGIADYTSSTDAATIVAELGGQVCGPLPAGSRLTSPLSAQIRQAGFVVQLVDLRSGTESAREAADREATAPVIDRLLSGDPNDPCTVPGGRVEASQADALATEFFTQGQIALGRSPVECPRLASGFPSPLVRAVTVLGGSPDQAVSVQSGGQTLASGTGFVTWVLPASGGSPPGPTVSGTTTGGPEDGCYADLSATIVPVGSQRVEPRSASTTLSWAVLGVGASSAADPASRLGPEAVSMAATIDGTDTSTTWDAASRTWQVVVPGPVDAVPVVAVTASADGFGTLATTSSNLQEGASLAPPRVAWSGPTVLEGSGTFGGRIGVVPAPLPDGAAIPDGVVCIEFGTPDSSSPDASLAVGEPRVCRPAGEPFEVNATITVTSEQNTTVLMVLPYTVTHRPAGSPADLVVSTGQTDLPSYSLTKAADPAKTALVTLVVVGLSTLLPLALLVWLINRERRLPAPSTRRVATVPLVAEGGVVRRPEGSRLQAGDLVAVEGDRNGYRLTSGMSVVRTRTLSPFAPMVVEATSENGSVSAFPWMAPGSGHSVQVPAGFTTLVLIRSVPGEDVADAVVIVPADTTPAEADRVVDRAVASTNELISRVSSAMRLVDL
jgi:hypothetical protein